MLFDVREIAAKTVPQNADVWSCQAIERLKLEREHRLNKRRLLEIGQVLGSAGNFGHVVQTGGIATNRKPDKQKHPGRFRDL